MIQVERDVEAHTIHRLNELCHNAQVTKRSLENRARYQKGEQREAFLHVISFIIHHIS